MNAELTQKLLKRFPILYQDYDSPMTQTCMCWGFDHGDGWFEIIWQLSLAIEEELGYSWPRERWYLLKKYSFRSGIASFLLCLPSAMTSASRKGQERKKIPFAGSSRKRRRGTGWHARPGEFSLRSALTTTAVGPPSCSVWDLRPSSICRIPDSLCSR
jgi:hypothetical protein